MARPSLAAVGAGYALGFLVMKLELALYQRTLSVRLIATPRRDFVCCNPSETLDSVRARNLAGDFDHLPVEDSGEIIGVLDTVATLSADGHTRVADCMGTIGEKLLLGADTSIIEFLQAADEKPFQFLITEIGIGSLVSLSDIQKLPVRAALFALITQLEMAMTHAIRQKFPGSEWMSELEPEDLRRLKGWLRRARRERNQIEELLYAGFGDKAKILSSFGKEIASDVRPEALLSDFMGFKQIRDKLAHAGDFADSRKGSKEVCRRVRQMNMWLDRISDWTLNAANGMK